VEVTFALLHVELDITIESVAFEVAQKFSERTIVSMLKSVRKEN
jgi:hypothetical protein